jgi:putative tricarboxylic transport membrane protein
MTALYLSPLGLPPLAASLGSIYTEGWALVAQPQTLLMIAAGVLIGLFVGAIPGLTANMGVAVLVSLTLTMEPTAAIGFLAGIWLGALYGGTIPAVLINMPGTPADIMSTLDGYPMSRRGEGGRAIGIGVLSSFLGGTISVLVLGVGAPLLAAVARNFGSAEYFAFVLLGLSVIAYVAGDSFLKGLASAALGLFLGTIGRDLLSGQLRFTFGQEGLNGGADFIAVVIGIFGMSEVLEQIYQRQHLRPPRRDAVRGIGAALRDVAPLRWVIARSSVVGTLVGALPGAGATIASVLAYGTQKRLSKTPEKMGTGAPEGLAASDSANNACTGGAMMTMLSIGIPGDSVTAILLGALIVQGVQPGPLLFDSDPELVSSIFLSLILANVFLLVFGLVAARRFVWILSVPSHLLLPAIIALSVIGTYAINNSTFDIGLMLAATVVGFLLSRAGIPKPPLVLALILGPILETNLRRLLELNRGDLGGSLMEILTSPAALPLFLAACAMFLLPLVQTLLGRRGRRQPTTTPDQGART